MRVKLVIATLLLFLCKTAYAVDNVTVDVIMMIQSVGIEAIKVHEPVATFPGTSRVVKGRSVFKNTGNGPEDFHIKIASTSGGWALQASPGTVPTGAYRLRAIWAVHNATITVPSFDDDDIISTTAQQSSDLVFFSNSAAPSDVGTPVDNGGYNIAQFGIGDNERHLFFRFDAGDTGTTGTSTAWVNVSATPTP